MKVYLSPSFQPENLYAVGNTNEQEQCRKIALACKAALVRCGIDCRMPEISSGSLNYKISDSNRFQPDFHVPIHTNATPQPTARGPRIFVYSDLTIGQAMLDALNAISPVPCQNGLSINKNLTEILHTSGKCIYVEAAFHDHPDEAAWIISHTAEIGEAIAEGICAAAKVPFLHPAPAPPAGYEEWLACYRYAVSQKEV